MSTKTFTVAPASPNRINIYDAMTGNLYKVITLPTGSQIVTSPVVFGDGFSITIKEPSGTYMVTYGFPTCNIRSKSHISS